MNIWKWYKKGQLRIQKSTNVKGNSLSDGFLALLFKVTQAAPLDCLALCDTVCTDPCWKGCSVWSHGVPLCVASFPGSVIGGFTTCVPVISIGSCEGSSFSWRSISLKSTFSQFPDHTKFKGPDNIPAAHRFLQPLGRLLGWVPRMRLPFLSKC